MTTARRTQQERRDQAEAALLNAAAELVVEHGVHSLTLARVDPRKLAGTYVNGPRGRSTVTQVEWSADVQVA